MPDLDASLRRASAGDKEALQELVVAHLDDLERFIRRRTSDRLLGKESLSDLVQSAAREALAHLSQHDYQGPTAFRAWLYKVALTKIIAHHRRLHADKRDVRREEPGDPEVHLAEVCATFSSPSGAAMAKELEARFTAAFARLNPDHQQVFFLVRVLELPYAEVAVQMGRSEEACRKLLVRALSSLGVHMGMDEGHAAD
ncbi:MAG: sigma-70 family RNA polymerase sigma factor [Planctomycetes bacterium]|nr:sigma-70 family RNA polymerase sigma factor [Planctomycetota bacterium]MCC7396566.1 sigma-70 family RNA polymerase sigma factor [Planctomycetota bacterium]